MRKTMVAFCLCGAYLLGSHSSQAETQVSHIPLPNDGAVVVKEYGHTPSSGRYQISASIHVNDNWSVTFGQDVCMAWYKNHDAKEEQPYAVYKRGENAGAVIIPLFYEHASIAVSNAGDRFVMDVFGKKITGDQSNLILEKAHRSALTNHIELARAICGVQRNIQFTENEIK